MPRDGGKPGPTTQRPRSARSAAFVALLRQVKSYPDLSPQRPPIEGLEARDGALALAIYEAAIRRWGTLAFLFEHTLERPWNELDEAVRAALLLGGAQLLFLDRVPAYAAIDETVEIIKTGPMSRATGLVNAGLRGLTRLAGLESGTLARIPAWNDARDALPLSEGGAVRLTRAVLPEDAARRISIAASVPKRVLEGWTQHFGAAQARTLALHKLVTPPITLNTQFAPDASAHELLIPHDDPGCHVLAAEGNELTRVLRDLPDAWVQDASSTRVVRALAAHATADWFGPAGPSLIVDLCAGNGTKTRHLARVFPNARILATDVDADRLATLREMAANPASVMPNVQVVPADTCEHEVARAAGATAGADIVLLDVPCSNSGVLPRRPEAAYRLATDQTARLAALQWEIVTRGSALLRPGGVLAYSTCSIDHEEDEAIAARAQQELSLRLVEQHKTLPTGNPGEIPTGYRDGAFHAFLVA
jgi:16S rRNA (cytosine967-C5)-methyltransferase